MNSFDWLRIAGDSVLAAAGTAFFMLHIERKKSGFLSLLFIEMVYRVVSLWFLINNTLELQQYKVSIYLVYMVFKLLWFRLYVQDFIRKYCCVYISLLVSCYSSGIILGGLSAKFSVILLFMIDRPQTWGALCARIFGAVITMLVSIAVYRTKWLNRLSDRTVSSIFMITLLFGEVISTLIFLKMSYSGVLILVCSAFHLIAAWVGVKYAEAQEEKRRLILKNEELERQIQIEYLYYKKLSVQEEEIRKIRHDLANHLQVLKGLGEAGKSNVEKYKQQISDSYLKLEEIEQETKKQMERQEPAKKRKIQGLDVLTGKGMAAVILTDGLLLLVLLQFVQVHIIGAVEVIVVEIIFCIGYLLSVGWKVYEEKRKQEHLNVQFVNGIRQQTDEAFIRQIYDLSRNLQTLTIEEEEDKLAWISQYSYTIITGNPAVDAMLSHKTEFCKQNDIVISCDLVFLSDYEVNWADLIGILANLLDNAVEACLRAEGRRHIRLYGRMKANIFLLKLENSKRAEEDPAGNGFATTKTDVSGHGNGMRIVKLIIDKYDGRIEYRDAGDVFQVIVSLPFKKQSGKR